jgi:iron-sulfur cluster repair protein YtfE (RIC family)
MTTPHIDPSSRINDVITRYPATVAIFTAFGMDACCGGTKSLEEAARRHGVALESLLAALDAGRATTAAAPGRGD